MAPFWSRAKDAYHNAPLERIWLRVPYIIRRWAYWTEWRYLYRRFIGFFHRGWYGWAPHDTWNLAWYLAGILKDALPYLAIHTHGFPPDFYPDGGKRIKYTREEIDLAALAWRHWLMDKAEWFEWFARDDDGTDPETGWIDPGLSPDERKRRIDAHHAKMKEFHEVVLPDFGRRFASLWD